MAPYTPENNPLIPGDPFSYDLKWMVEQINGWKDPLDSADRAKASEEAAASSAQHASDDAELASNSAQAAASLVEPVTEDLTEQASRLAALEGRMDSFSALAEGSTTGDAELMDIRVADNGLTYNTAGDAVRAQAGLLKELIDYTAKNIIQVPTSKNIYSGMKELNGYILTNGALVINSGFVTSDYIDVEGLTEIVCSRYSPNPSYPRTAQPLYRLTTYDADKQVLSYDNNYNSNTYTVDPGVKYIRFCVNTGTQLVAVENGSVYSPTFIPYTYRTLLKNPAAPDWTAKKWCCVGDSLTANNIRTDIHYFDYVSENTGISIVNMGDGGSGYAKEQDLGTAFYQRISSVPADSDVITIFGSFNDKTAGLPLGSATDSGTATIGGCINTTFDNLFSALPLANLGVVTPTPWENSNPLDPTDWASQYCNLIVEICRLRGIPCLDLFHCSALRPWEASFRALAYSKDGGAGTHPDETGHKIIAPRFQSFLATLI